MTDNTFTVNNRECRVGADGKVLTKVTFGPESWGAEAWVPYNIKGQEAELGFMGDFPKIPFEQILLVREFFAMAYEVHKTEAFVYFSMNYDTSTYDIVVPPRQQATSGHVSFSAHLPWYCAGCYVGSESVDQPEECPVCGGTHFNKTRVVGTAHSHGSMAAFHSGTDDANELDTTGFHITFGKVDRPLLEIAHSYVVAQRGMLDSKGQGIRFKENLDVGELIDIPFVSERPTLRRWTSLIISDVALKNLPDEAPLLMHSTPVGYTILSMSGDLDHYGRVKASMDLTGGVQEVITMQAGNYKKVLELEAAKKRKAVLKTKSRVGLTQSKPLVRSLDPPKLPASTPTYLKSFSPTKTVASGPGLTSDPLLDKVADWAKPYAALHGATKDVKFVGTVRKDMLSMRCSYSGDLYPSDGDSHDLAMELGSMIEKLDEVGRADYFMRVFSELVSWSSEALEALDPEDKNLTNWLDNLADEAPNWTYDCVDFPCSDMIEVIHEGLSGRDGGLSEDQPQDLEWFDVLEPLHVIMNLLMSYNRCFPAVWARDYIRDLKSACLALTKAGVQGAGAKNDDNVS